MLSSDSGRERERERDVHHVFSCLTTNFILHLPVSLYLPHSTQFASERQRNVTWATFRYVVFPRRRGRSNADWLKSKGSVALHIQAVQWVKIMSVLLLSKVSDLLRKKRKICPFSSNEPNDFKLPLHETSLCKINRVFVPTYLFILVKYYQFRCII